MLADAIVIAVGNAPVPSFDKSIAADALIFALVIVPLRIAVPVTALSAISLALIPPVATFNLPLIIARVPLAMASEVNSVSSMMLFINVLVITSLVAKVLVVFTTPAILFL